jgi:hypothetical protein
VICDKYRGKNTGPQCVKLSGFTQLAIGIDAGKVGLQLWIIAAAGMQQWRLSLSDLREYLPVRTVPDST